MDKELIEKGTHALAAKPAPKGKKKIRMSIMPADNEGYVVDHEEMDAPNPPMRSSHVFEKLKGVHDHIEKHYGKPKAKKDEKEKKDNPVEELEEAMADKKMGS